MAKKPKNKKPKSITKAGAKERRKNPANINQKHQIFSDKRTKRNKTRKTQEEKAIEESKEEK